MRFHWFAKKQHWLPLVALLTVSHLIPATVTAAVNTICFTLISFPSERWVSNLLRGPDGNIWFSELFVASPQTYAIGTIASNGPVDFPVPYSPQSMTSGPDGNIWYISGNPSPNSSGEIVRMTPQGQTTTYSAIGSRPAQIAPGSDGNLWIAAVWSDNQIERMTTDGEITGHFAIPTPNSGPIGLVLGGDSNLWFLEWNYNRIGRIDMSGNIAEFEPNSKPSNLVLGGDSNLWFVERNVNKIGRIDTNGNITEFDPLPKSDDAVVTSIAAGADGNIWFTEIGQIIPYHFFSYVNRITKSGTITRFPKMDWYELDELVLAADGNVWSRLIGFQGTESDMIRISPDGSYTIFTPYNADFYSGGTATLADGTIWVTGYPFFKGIAYFNPLSISPTCHYHYYFPWMSQ